MKAKYSLSFSVLSAAEKLKEKESYPPNFLAAFTFSKTLAVLVS